MKRITLILVLILVVGVIGISGCIGSDDTTNGNYTNTSAQSSNNTVKNSTIFENQYVKFKIPEGLNVEDNSTDTKIDVCLLKDANLIGEINDATNEPNKIKAGDAFGDKEITVAGKEALEYSDSLAIGCYIFVEGNKGLWTDFDPEYSDAYNTIKTTLVIKKMP